MLRPFFILTMLQYKIRIPTDALYRMYIKFCLPFYLLQDGKFFFVQQKRFDSLADLVQYYQEHNLPSGESCLGKGYKHFERS